MNKIVFLFIYLIHSQNIFCQPSLSEGAKFLFNGVTTKLTNEEKDQIFKSLKFNLSKDKKQFVNESDKNGEYPFEAEVITVDINGDGKEEIVFDEMKDPFYAVDSRDYQVVEPKHNNLLKIGATILAIEKERPHIQLERAIMAVRFNEYMIGTQFHPEADPIGMSKHLQTAEKKKTVIENYGEEKWTSMIEQLNDPDKIVFTYEHILPNFLQIAVENLQL